MGVLEPRRAVEDHLAVALTQRDRDILDFERSWWTATSPKDVQIRERFELSATRYYQLLAELLEDGESMSYDPLVVRRLQRQRDRRRRQAPIKPRTRCRQGARPRPHIGEKPPSAIRYPGQRRNERTPIGHDHSDIDAKKIEARRRISLSSSSRRTFAFSSLISASSSLVAP